MYLSKRMQKKQLNLDYYNGVNSWHKFITFVQCYKGVVQMGILSSWPRNMQALVIFDKAPRTLILVVTSVPKHPWIDTGLSCQEQVATFSHLLWLHIWHWNALSPETSLLWFFWGYKGQTEKLICSVIMLTRSIYRSYFDLGSCKISGKRSLLLKFHVL